MSESRFDRGLSLQRRAENIHEFAKTERVAVGLIASLLRDVTAEIDRLTVENAELRARDEALSAKIKRLEDVIWNVY